MKAVILAGGKGTRLGALTASIPKPMVELAGKPIVQYQVELCARFQLDGIIFIVNHLGSIIQDYFGDGESFGIPISYYYEKEPLGTVGGLIEVQEALDDDFLVLYGDVMMDMDLARLFEFHQTNSSEATLVVHPNDHPYDSDLIEMDEDNRVVKVLPKPHAEGLRYHNMVNAAVYVFNKRIFQFLERGVKADFGRDIFPRVYDQLKMYAYNTPEYLKDMGTPDRMQQVEADVLNGKVARRNLSNQQKAIFLDRDGVINVDTDLIHRVEDFELYDFTAEAIKRINKSEFISVVTTNQSVVARNLTDLQGLGEIHKKMETALGAQGAKLDEIKFCPHHPDKGFPEENVAFKIDCDCRKPKPGMLLEAAEQFNIELSKSWMIGDSERDTLAGKAAGCTTVGVMTGHGHKKAATLPDYFFANLAEAVDFILNDPWRKELGACKDQIEVLQSSGKGPVIISIAGNSRSGKTTFCTKLKKELISSGKNVELINLDDWIRPKQERLDRDEVLYNFQIEKMEQDLQEILKGAKVELDAYQHHPLRKPANSIYHITSADVIIIDGVVALATEQLRRLSDLKIFMEIDEEALKRRFEVFYQWKGLDSSAIKLLWEQRLKNEYRVIAEHGTYADMLIN